MKTTACFILALLLFQIQFGFAQTDGPNVPKSYTLEKKEDYAPYRDQVLENIIWLENTPITKENLPLRKPAQKFVMTWLLGNPDIHPPLIQNIIEPVMNEHQSFSGVLMGSFLFGEAKAMMESEEEIPEIELYTKGIESMIKAYERIHPKVKLKSMEKYKKMIKKKKLRAWLEDLTQ